MVEANLCSVTSTSVYWITRLDELKAVIDVFLGVVLVTVVLCGAFVSAESYLEKGCGLKGTLVRTFKSVRALLVALAVFIVLHVFVPSTKDAIAMFTVPRAVNSNIFTEEIPAAIERAAKNAYKEQK